MFEEAESTSLDHSPPASDKSSILRYVLLAAAAIYVIATLYLMYDMRTRVLTLEQKQLATEVAQEESGQAHSRYFVGIQAGLGNRGRHHQAGDGRTRR